MEKQINTKKHQDSSIVKYLKFSIIGLALKCYI